MVTRSVRMNAAYRQHKNMPSPTLLSGEDIKTCQFKADTDKMIALHSG